MSQCIVEMKNSSLRPFTSSFPFREPPEIQHAKIRAKDSSQSRPVIRFIAVSHNPELPAIGSPRIADKSEASCLAKARLLGVLSRAGSMVVRDANSDVKIDCNVRLEGMLVMSADQ